jgi:hypothetical protein
VPWFHHRIDFKSVIFDRITPSEDVTRKKLSSFFPERIDIDIETLPNLWLEKQIGFYPLFLAYGETDEDIRMTGYQQNWMRVISSRYQCGKNIVEYVKKGEAKNYILFSFESVQSPVFIDYDEWFCVLNSYPSYDIKKSVVKRLFKPDWNREQWTKKVRREPHHVMVVVPHLDLRLANRIWARNKKTVTELHKIGFTLAEKNRISMTSQLD